MTYPSQQYLIWKLTLFAKIYHLNSLHSDQNFGRRRLAKLRRFDRKIKKRFLTTYFCFFFPWEKKTDVKVHYENSWLWKISVKQKCRSWNFGILVDSERFCLYIKSYFFSKRRLKKLFFSKTQKSSKKKDKCQFSN